MDKDILYTVGGLVIGSLIEEGIEEFFPGVGELGYAGEIAGSISGLLSSKLTKEETKRSIEMFIKYAYKRINKANSLDSVTDEELKMFAKNFKNIPEKQKKEILNNFKNLAPNEFEYLYDFLANMEE